MAPAAAIFALLLLPAIAGGDAPGHWVVWLSITLITGWLTFLVALEPDGTRYVIRAVVASALFQALVAIWEFRTKHQLYLYGTSGSQAASGETFFLYGQLLRPSGTLPDPIGLRRSVGLVGAHPDLSRQEVKAFRVFTVFSSLTASSILIRQPIESLSPWAWTLTNTAGCVVVVS